VWLLLPPGPQQLHKRNKIQAADCQSIRQEQRHQSTLREEQERHREQPASKPLSVFDGKYTYFPL